MCGRARRKGGPVGGQGRLVHDPFLGTGYQARGLLGQGRFAIAYEVYKLAKSA